MRQRFWVVAPLALVLAFTLALVNGCQPQEEEQPAQENGQQEETQTTLALSTVEQWGQSGHATPIVFAAEEEGCKNCHDGLTFSETGGGFQPRFTETSPTTEGTGSAETTAPRDWVVATDCRACHTGRGVEIAEQGSIDGVPNLETAEGGMGAVCMACHNGWHPAGSDDEGALRAPHHSTQTDAMFGVNVLQVGGAEATATPSDEESESAHTEVENLCVGCHVTGAGDDPNHLFSIESYEGCQREGCHDEDMTDGGQAQEDYDGDGQSETVAAEIEGLMTTLEDAINQSAGSSEFSSEGGEIVFEGGGDVSPDDPAYQAAYNYLYVEADGSGGLHNAPFTVRILQQSIAGVSQ